MSWRRLIRVFNKLRRCLRPPRSARDVVSSYEEYRRLQTTVYRSFEADVPRWVAGQDRFIEEFLSDVPRTVKVLDCACGDGTGLAALRRRGIRDAMGIDLCREKVLRARERGFSVAVGDMHDLGFLPSASVDVVLSSHTLEHAYDPHRVLAEFARVLRAGGELFVVVPYPDGGSKNDRAHVGKFSLGTHVDDGGETVTRFFTERGWELVARRQDGFREPELWLRLRWHQPSCGVSPSPCLDRPPE